MLSVIFHPHIAISMKHKVIAVISGLQEEQHEHGQGKWEGKQKGEME
jgi:hypothetical protein